MVTDFPGIIESWRQLHFGTTANSGDAADSFDFDHDGISNLLEWALLLHPKEASMLPVALTAGGLPLEFDYVRNVAALDAGALLSVQWSDTLIGNGWSTLDVTEDILSDDGNEQQVLATIPMGTGGRRFVRLEVTAPP